MTADHYLALFEVLIPKTEWLSANDRYNRYETARRTNALRTRGGWIARKLGLPKNIREPLHCVAVVSYPRNTRRADPPNSAPTVKALIDGLIDYGLVPDDDDKHLPVTSYMRDRAPFPGSSKSQHLVRLFFAPPEMNLINHLLTERPGK